VPVLLLVFVVLAGLGLAIVGFRNYGSPPVEGRQTAFHVMDDGSVRVTLQVVREQPQRPAVCVVRARSVDGDETGRKEVFVPPGSRSVLLDTVVRTSRRAVTGEVFGCSYEVPEYLIPTTG